MTPSPPALLPVPTALRVVRATTSLLSFLFKDLTRMTVHRNQISLKCTGHSISKFAFVMIVQKLRKKNQRRLNVDLHCMHLVQKRFCSRSTKRGVSNSLLEMGILGSQASTEKMDFLYIANRGRIISQTTFKMGIGPHLQTKKRNSSVGSILKSETLNCSVCTTKLINIVRKKNINWLFSFSVAIRDSFFNTSLFCFKKNLRFSRTIV